MSRQMFLRKLRKCVAALPALAFGFMASPAFSTTVVINASGVSTGSSTASFLGATLTSVGGTFTKSTTTGTNPSTVIGISGGALSNEADISGEKFTLSFGGTAVTISEITIGLLFAKDVSGNIFADAVQMQTDGGTACGSSAPMPCILSGSGVWKSAALPASAILSPGTEGNGGIFKITNPFGSELISSIDFLPWSISGSGAANSDFALVSVTYTTTLVPEPGTLSLVGLGLAGLAFARGRRARG